MPNSNGGTDSRDRILGCACDLYLEDGFEGFSMRKLAQAVGVTAPALYRHYDSKEALLLDVVGEGFKVMAQYLHTALAGTTPEERFRIAGEAYLEFALDHPRYYEILYSYPQLLGLEEPPEELEPLVCGIGQFWNDRVRECMESGFLRPGDPDAVSLSFWAQAHGLISIYLRRMLPMGEPDFRAAYMEAARRLIAGVGTAEARARIQETVDATPLPSAPPLNPSGDGDRTEPRATDEPAIREEAQ